jgi:hypothetical protein
MKTAKTIEITLPSIEDVEFNLISDYDDTPVKGNALASGDDQVDKECEDEIIERLDNGDHWAWALVTMEANYKGLTGVDYLGSCSYKDEEEFKNGGYYEDMKNNAYNDLINQIKALEVIQVN